MVIVNLLTTGSPNLYLAYWLLHFRVGSGLTRVFFFTRKLFSSALVMVPILVTTDS